MPIKSSGVVTQRQLIEQLHAICSETIIETMADNREQEVARRYLFSSELQIWNKALQEKEEVVLYTLAQGEYLTALLNLCQGQYRNSFKGLRLVLELYLQGVKLSADPISLYEWLNEGRDTVWAAIIDEDNGIFSRRFCSAFFPELEGKSKNFGTMSRTLYRELSSCTHGNSSNDIPLPKSLLFNLVAFETWMNKADVLRTIIHFSLSMRYLKNIPKITRQDLEAILLEELGHLEPVRAFLGGPRS